MPTDRTNKNQLPSRPDRPPHSSDNVNINDMNDGIRRIPNELLPTKPWYSSREDIPIVGECTYGITSSGNDQLPQVGISCTCDSDTMLDGDMSNGEYAPLDFEAVVLKSFGSKDNQDNDCCTPSLYDWYNTLLGEDNLPCTSPVLGNSQCDYISSEGMRKIDFDGEEFFITLEGNSAFTGHIDCNNRNWMWITKWCVGDYTSTDCVEISIDTNKMKIADICPPPCTNPSDCSEITIWLDSNPNFRDDSRQCNFEIHSYYNWEDNTDTPEPPRGNRGPYLVVPLSQEGGAIKTDHLPDDIVSCPPHINCPPGQQWIDWPDCECRVIFEPWSACFDPEACNYNPNAVNPCEDCCMYYVCPDGTCARTSEDCPDFLNPGCINPEACNYCPPFFQDENGVPCEELAGPSWNTSGSQTCPCTPEPELCWFPEPSCDCGGEIVGDFCDCNEGVEEIWCPDLDGDGFGSCVGVQEQCPVIACDGSQPGGWVNNCSDDCDHPNGFDCFGVCGGVATFDDCGVCGGNCNLPDNCDGACNCDGDTNWDSCGVCGGSGGTYQCFDGSFECTEEECATPVWGCMNSSACNYDTLATNDNGSCYFTQDNAGIYGCNPNGDGTSTSNGVCELDTDLDLICDQVDDCVGSLDFCGVCNGTCVDGSPDSCTQLDICNVCYGPGASVECYDGSVVCLSADCPTETSGCTNPSACNFLPTAINDDGSCWYVGDNICGSGTQECCNCNGSVFDQCGVCGGDNSTCCPGGCTQPTPNCVGGSCECSAGSAGCDGICGSGLVVDQCGICGGDNSSCSDCAGTANGNVIVDCNGVCGGDWIEDCNGVCYNPENNPTNVEDCNGVCNGSAVEDCAGVCGGTSVKDCNGVCNGTWVEDCLGVCYNPDNNPSNVEDCEGVCNGNSIEDCTGECGGSAYVDCLGGCNGGAFDCGGVCVSSSTVCGCTDDTALNYDATATADNGSCYYMNCNNFSSCDQYCPDGSNYCTTPSEIDTFCYTNNEFPAIYIRAGDIQYVSFTIPIIDGQDSYPLIDVINNSLYDSNPDEGAANLQSWAAGTNIFADVNFTDGDIYSGYSQLSQSTGTWLGNLITLEVSAGYYIYSLEAGWLKWTLPE